MPRAKTTIKPQHEKLLSDLYYSKKNYFGRDKLFDLVKNLEDRPTRSQVMEWLRAQEAHQLHIKPKKTSTIRPIIATKPDVYYQADLMDLGEKEAEGKRYIFTLIDAFTKQAFAEPMKNKDEGTSLKAFKKLLAQVREKGKKFFLLFGLIFLFQFYFIFLVLFSFFGFILKI